MHCMFVDWWAFPRRGNCSDLVCQLPKCPWCSFLKIDILVVLSFFLLECFQKAVKRRSNSLRPKRMKHFLFSRNWSTQCTSQEAVSVLGQHCDPILISYDCIILLTLLLPLGPTSMIAHQYSKFDVVLNNNNTTMWEIHIRRVL